MAKRNKAAETESFSPRVKKQKLEDETNASTNDSTSHGSAQEIIPSKNRREPGAKCPKKLRAKMPPRTKVPKVEDAPVIEVKEISKVVRSKLQQVLEFHTARSPALSSALDRDGGNQDHATVTESAVIGALMRMRNDYEMAQPNSLDDVSELVVYSFEKRIGNNPSVNHVVLDLSKRSPFEDSIHSKLEGQGLAEVGLLEIELELLTHDVERAATDDLFRHMQTSHGESDSGTDTSVTHEDLNRRDEGEQVALLDDTREIAKIGVCPAPLMEL